MSALMSDGNHYYPFICFLLRQANSHSEHGSLSRTSSNEYGSTSNLSDATKQVNTVCCWRQQTAASPHLMRRSRAWLSITRVHCTELFVNCLSDMTWVASSWAFSVRIRESNARDIVTRPCSQTPKGYLIYEFGTFWIFWTVASCWGRCCSVVIAKHIWNTAIGETKLWLVKTIF